MFPPYPFLIQVTSVIIKAYYVPISPTMPNISKYIGGFISQCQIHIENIWCY